jgi:hypothetical protein
MPHCTTIQHNNKKLKEKREKNGTVELYSPSHGESGKAALFE